MKFYQFVNPVQICSGKGSIATHLASKAKEIGCKRVLVVCGPVINKLGLADKVVSCLTEQGVEVGTKFHNVPNESSVSTIKEICDIYRQNFCDSIVAIGGGSVLDTAKAVRLLLSQNAEDISKYFGYNMSKIGIKIPFIAIPTTCGTGAEVTKVSVICNDKTLTKEEIISDLMLPDVAILDCDTLNTLPLKSVLLTAFDALSHAIEGYCSKGKNALSDVYSRLAIVKIYNNLKQVINGNGTDEEYSALLEGACYAGISFSNSMVGGVHAIAHSLGSVLNVSHDYAVANLLPYVLQFNLDYSEKEYAELYDLLVQEKNYIDTRQKAVGFINALHNFYFNNVSKIGGIPKISECGLNDDTIEKIAKLALTDGALLTNVRYMEYNDIVNILEEMRGNANGKC